MPAGSPFTQFRWGLAPAPMEAVVGFSRFLADFKGWRTRSLHWGVRWLMRIPNALSLSRVFLRGPLKTENCFLHMSPCALCFIEDGLVGGCPWYPKPGSDPTYGTFLGCGFNTGVDKRWTFGTPWLREKALIGCALSETEPLHSVRVLAS